jgi:hypothetical protein
VVSCSPVKEYEKGKINDSEMVLSNRKIEKTEMSFQSYREGPSGANAGKSRRRLWLQLTPKRKKRK